MWLELTGYKLVEFAGVSGTITLPKGAIVLLTIAHASGGGATVTTINGTVVPVISGANPLYIQNYHALQQQNSGTTTTMVFTSTDMYYVQVAQPGNY